MNPLAQYFTNIWQALSSITIGLKTTGHYIWRRPAVTIQYPEEKEQLPPRARMRLYNDVENCISCNLCAAACPVDCIYIASKPRAPGSEIPKTSSGTAIKLELTQFTIDTALCCYCGLCTVPCPTECLTHTLDYEFSNYAVNGLKIDYLNDDVKSWRNRILAQKSTTA